MRYFSYSPSKARREIGWAGGPGNGRNDNCDQREFLIPSPFRVLAGIRPAESVKPLGEASMRVRNRSSPSYAKARVGSPTSRHATLASERWLRHVYTREWRMGEGIRRNATLHKSIQQLGLAERGAGAGGHEKHAVAACLDGQRFFWVPGSSSCNPVGWPGAAGPHPWAFYATRVWRHRFGLLNAAWQPKDQSRLSWYGGFDRRSAAGKFQSRMESGLGSVVRYFFALAGGSTRSYTTSDDGSTMRGG